MKRSRFLQVLCALMFSARAFADTFSGRVIRLTVLRSAVLVVVSAVLACASPFTVTHGYCNSGVAVYSPYYPYGGYLYEWDCSVFPTLNYRYLDNGYALEITGTATVDPLPWAQWPEGPRDGWKVGWSAVEFLVTLEGLPPVESVPPGMAWFDPMTSAFTWMESYEFEGWDVWPGSEAWGHPPGTDVPFPWIRDRVIPYPSWGVSLKLGARGGPNWGPPMDSSFKITFRPALITPSGEIPMRPILVGSERPAFVDTPEPAAWQLVLVGLGLLAWRVKKPFFLRG